MADGFIVRRGGKAEEVLRTATPDINFVSKTDSEIVVTFKNNDAGEAEIYYGLTAPLTDTVTLATGATSSNITFSGLDDNTEFTVSAYAIVTDATLKKIKSEIVSTSITTDETPFSPADLSPQLWLDAADSSTITQSSGSVSQWNNKGSLGNFTNGSSATQPTTGATTLNGLNVIDFDGDFLNASTASEWKFLHDETIHEIFVVVKINSLNTIRYIYGTSDETGTSGVIPGVQTTGAFRSEVNRSVGGTQTVSNATSSSFITVNQWAILSNYGDYTNSTAADRSEIRKNGGAAVKNNTLTNAPSTANPKWALYVGTLGAAYLSNSDKSIAEMIVISGANATSQNRTNIINYLSNKWGITI